MSEALGPQPWIADPATTAVMDALEAAGGPGCARFVGGAVRNAVLGGPVEDIDIATTLEPPAVIAALQAAGLKAVPTGVEHGTVTAVSARRPYEITTLRRDVETDGRRAVVAFTQDWGQDAARRDFTLNALYADRRGVILDPGGTGLADARAGRIVFVGDPATRIAEDYLRILRFFRFFAWYGRGTADAAALSACAAMSDGLAGLSAERISKELLKLLAADDPRASVRLMDEAGVLRALVPQAQGLARFEALVEIQADQFFPSDPLLRLAALLGEDADRGVTLAATLRLSNDQRARLTASLGREPRIASWMGAREIRRAIYAIGARALADRAMLTWAGAGATSASHQWRALLALAASWTPPPFPVTGDDAILAGAPKGPKVGEALKEVELWWIDNDFTDDRAAAVERLKAVVQGMS